MSIDKRKYIVCYLTLLILCWLFPYTGDDWAWGSSIGLERLTIWFDNYNGRYVGNLIVLALTRSNLLKSTVMAFCLTGIIYCIERLSRNKSSFYIACVLLLMLPRLVFRQAIVWTAGFSNYVTSIFFTLLYIVYIYDIFDEKTVSLRKNNYLHCFLLFVLGVVNTLIVEHLTVYNIALAICVLVVTWLRFKTVLLQHVFYLLGTIMGTYYMFSNAVYHAIIQNEDGYRSVAVGGVIWQFAKNFLSVIYSELYMNNLILNFVILALCILLYYQLYTKKNKNNDLMKFCLYIMCAYVLYSAMSITGLANTTKGLLLIIFEGVFTIAGALAVIIFTYHICIKTPYCYKLFFIIGSIICLTVPLFAVNPIGSRCFFATYVMFIVFVCELFNMATANVKVSEKAALLLKRICTMTISVALIFYFIIFGSIYYVDKERLTYIHEQMTNGETQIEILHLPYEEYLWMPTPGCGDLWETRYKLFYDIPEEVQLIPVWEYSKN